MKKILMTGLVLLAATGFVCCGGGSGGGGGDAPSITTISSLPTATSPMASEASAMVVKDLAKAATTGLNIVATTKDAFGPRTSMGACNTFNQVKDGITSAAQADQILCFVKQLDAAAKFTGLKDSAGKPIDIYDGAYHIFNLNFTNLPEGENPPHRVKMRIVKAARGNIASFEMFMCRLLAGGASMEQNEYTRQAIDGVNYEMLAMGRHGDDKGEGWHQVDAVGTLNAKSEFTARAITVRNKGTWGGGTNWSEGTLTQAPGTFLYTGYHKGGFVDPETELPGTNADRAFALGQMIGDTGALSALAMGDGAVHYGSEGKPPVGDAYSQEGFDAWDGDTAGPVSTNDYLAGAIAGTPPTPQDEPAIAFGSGESWDCTDDAGVGIYDLPQVDFPQMKNSCSAYAFNHEWIQCFEKIGKCNVDNVCGGRPEEHQASCIACFPDKLKADTTHACLVALCGGDTPCIADMDKMCGP